MSVSQTYKWLRLMRKIRREEPTPVTIVTSKVSAYKKQQAAKLYLSLKHDDDSLLTKFELSEHIRKVLQLNNNMVAPEYVDEYDRLKEKMRAMGDETPENGDELMVLRTKIVALNANDSVKIELLKKLNQMETYGIDSESSGSIRANIECALSLPYHNQIEMKIPSSQTGFSEWFTRAREILDKRLYGMKNVKEELLLAAVSRFTCPSSIVSIGLEGPPGVGKTAIVSAFAEVMGLPFERVALGGLEDSSVFKGQNKHWLGSGPSIILEILSRFKYSNGIILLDEIDKLGDTSRGRDVQNALLHITDYTQNSEFRDTYLSDFPHDISKVWFMYSLNDVNSIDNVLRDRLHIIKVQGYSRNDLKEITKNYVLPRALEKTGIPLIAPNGDINVKMSDDAIDSILQRCDIKTQGVRTIDRMIRDIVTRINFLRVSDPESAKLVSFYIPSFTLPRVLSVNDVEKLMGKPEQREQLTYFL